MTSGSSSGSIGNLSQLGVSVNSDGTLALDSTALNAALNTHYQDVVGYLQDAGSFGQTFSSTIDNLGSTNATGALYLALASDANQETALNKNVTNQEQIIATEKTTLTAQLNLANQTLQGIPQQLNEIDQLYNALTGYTPPKG